VIPVNSSDQAQFEQILATINRRGAAGFSELEVHRYSQYYALVLKWNKRLHLTTITNPKEFAQRHIGESAFAESHLLDSITQVWDLGTGLGVPGIPMAVLRPDISFNLVDANRAKTIFLEETVSALQLANVKVICERLESLAELPHRSCLTVRALEKMKWMIPEVLRVGANCPQILIFGNQKIGSLIERSLGEQYCLKPWLIPQSERRWLFALLRST
jgi:16S rRNA (guanine(527)-N(7))-methyltransferase RsmG